MATAQRVCYIFNDDGLWHFKGLDENRPWAQDSLRSLRWILPTFDDRSEIDLVGHRHRIGAMRSAFAVGYTHADIVTISGTKRVKLKRLCE